MNTSKIIVALDNYSPYMAREIIAKYSQQVYGFKMNHTLYPYIGKEYNNVFCDYKLYDIPSTVCNVIEHLIDSGAEMVTVNMNNNLAVFEAIEQYSDKIKLLGVTALTSWDHNDPNSIHRQEIGNMYDRTTWIMEKYNFWGMICSPRDLKLLKNVTRLKKICPGIRNENDGKQDQVRTATPEEAFENGADYLVMGRSFFKSI